MDELAREYAGKAHFIFVYAREAHPDEFPDHPAHGTFEQKLQHARDMQRLWNTPRTIVVDSLDGDVHRQYSGCPNMSFVIDHAGLVFFKGGWTVANDLRAALDGAIQLREIKRENIGGAPYYQEQVSYARFTEAYRGRVAEHRARMAEDWAGAGARDGRVPTRG